MSRRRKFDFCWGCGAITGLHCSRCKKPVCVVVGSPVPSVGCSRLRKAPGRIGVFLLVCWPRCRLRRSPHVLALARPSTWPKGLRQRAHVTGEVLR